MHSSLCIWCRTTKHSISIPSSKQALSTLSAIRKGIHASRDGEAKRGGSDRSRRPSAPSTSNSSRIRRRTGKFDGPRKDALASSPERQSKGQSQERELFKSFSRGTFKDRSNEQNSSKTSSRIDLGRWHRQFDASEASVQRPTKRSLRKELADSSSGKLSRARSHDRDSLGWHSKDDAVISIPYTTAASQFIYGYNSVLAALRGGHRKLYRLYIHPKTLERDSNISAEVDRPGKHTHGERLAQELVALAKEASVPLRHELNIRLLDKMSEGRPHNGLVLEASRLPAPPVTSLGKPDQRNAVIPLNLGTQAAEEVTVNGNPKFIHATGGTWRYPLVVFIDGIVDPGNLGNIMRTCHFYGVDAIAVATPTCANISLGSVAKASSGACEAVRLLAVNQPAKFIFDSAKYKWKIYAAVAPTIDTNQRVEHITTLDITKNSPLAKHPCILMLGSEGEGLRENLKKKADHFVSINKGSRPNDSAEVGLDSLNVTVAAGVLLESFLTKPASAPGNIDTLSELGF